MNLLGNAFWGGVSAIAALVTIAIMLYDRKTKRKNDIFRTFFKMAGFFVLGACYGPFIMVAAGTAASILSAMGVGPMRGHIGEVGLILSQFRLGYWGFNPEMSPLELQVGALALWLGGAAAGMMGVIKGMAIDLQFEKLNRTYLVIPFYSVVMAVLLAAINWVLNSGL